MSEQWRALALCAAFPDLPWIAEPVDPVVGRRVCDDGRLCRPVLCTRTARRSPRRNAISSGFWAGHERDPAQLGQERGMSAALQLSGEVLRDVAAGERCLCAADRP